MKFENKQVEDKQEVPKEVFSAIVKATESFEELAGYLDGEVREESNEEMANTKELAMQKARENRASIQEFLKGQFNKIGEMNPEEQKELLEELLEKNLRLRGEIKVISTIVQLYNFAGGVGLNKEEIKDQGRDKVFYESQALLKFRRDKE